MASYAASGPVFQETQWFYRRWWWLMLGASALLISPLLRANQEPAGRPALLIAGPLLLVVLAGLGSVRLKVRVDATGIHYQYTPFINRWRHWPWREFRQVFPRTYSPLGDYGGWGLRGLPGNLAYSVWGKKGLQLVFKSGNKLLLGTQRPAELYEVLVALHAGEGSIPILLSAS